MRPNMLNQLIAKWGPQLKKVGCTDVEIAKFMSQVERMMRD